MAGSVTNFMYHALRANDEMITDPLGSLQMDGRTFYIRALSAAAQILTSTVTLVATSVFALLSVFAGLVCRGAGELQTGNDLIQSAAVAFLGNGPSAQEKSVAGAVSHLLLFGFSVANLASVGFLPVCLKVAAVGIVIHQLAKTEP